MHVMTEYESEIFRYTILGVISNLTKDGRPIKDIGFGLLVGGEAADAAIEIIVRLREFEGRSTGESDTSKL